MKFDPASSVRQAAAIRLMQRVEAITKSARAEPITAEGERGVALATRHLMDELEALRLAEKCPLHRGAGVDGYYYPHRGRSGEGGVHSTTIRRLIDKGLMEWGNSIRTWVVLTDEGRRGRNDTSIG